MTMEISCKEEASLVAMIRLVRGAALVAALADGRLGAAGLDVFENEPSVPEALFAMDNVILQPHQGSATIETRNRMAEIAAGNVVASLRGEPLPNAVVVGTRRP